MFCIECEGSVPKSMSVLSVFATVFTSEIFSNFNWNALKSPNISAHGGAAVGTCRVETNQSQKGGNCPYVFTNHMIKMLLKPFLALIL